MRINQRLFQVLTRPPEEKSQMRDDSKVQNRKLELELEDKLDFIHIMTATLSSTLISRFNKA